MPPRNRPRPRPPRAHKMILRRTERGIFGKLPMELMLEVLGHLQYDAAIFLAATNHYYRRLVDPLTVVSEERKLEFLARAEYFQQHMRIPYGFAACFWCYRVKKVRHYFEQINQPSDYHNVPFSCSGPWQICSDCQQVPQVLSHPKAFAKVVQVGSETTFLKWNCETCEGSDSQNQELTCAIVHGGCARCGHCIIQHDHPLATKCPTCEEDIVSSETQWSWACRFSWIMKQKFCTISRQSRAEFVRRMGRNE
ncbi:uncharacterized protein J3D65DRAFT_700120 [Phyllosticta citribraziliensis]|uniref:F-box domain-containing protein n=1 Tax=Phyllosticta citribraziliensis TaxID=989973 RepID=A0ABR1LEV1_9PEZI